MIAYMQGTVTVCAKFHSRRVITAEETESVFVSSIQLTFYFLCGICCCSSRDSDTANVSSAVATITFRRLSRVLTTSQFTRAHRMFQVVFLSNYTAILYRFMIAIYSSKITYFSNSKMLCYNFNNKQQIEI